ncbi:MAG: DUF1761 domain-containing protein [Chloroflexi bacterium]|nr:MAG: DUF1761 domain-containing protein [Chloroflexota bacterium]
MSSSRWSPSIDATGGSADDSLARTGAEEVGTVTRRDPGAARADAAGDRSRRRPGQRVGYRTAFPQPRASSVGDGILLGALVWLGFGATFKAAQVTFERRPWAVWGIQAIHDLVAEVVVAAIVTLWR